MARHGWLGLPRLGFSPRPRTVSCVLSGGGSRASFQLGALSFLYAHDPRFTPSIFVGTSAGSILASGLAQYAERGDQQAFTERLSAVWRAMDASDQMFMPRPWLARAETEMPGWLGMLAPASPPRPAAPPAARRLSLFNRPDSAMTPMSPLSPLEPIELALLEDQEVKPEWSFAALAQIVGSLGRLPRMGTDLAAIRLGMEQTRSMYRPGPVLARILDPEVFDEDRVATSGMTLRVAMVELESGELRFMREDGRLVDRENVQVDDTPYRLVNGILASCAIPAVFRPVPLGTGTFIDGGARETIPAEMAIGHLRAERSYVISSACEGVAARPSMAESDIFAVVMRATEILMEESSRDELAYALSTDAVVIHPELSVHEAMTVHPGLTAINSDYGWMRAAEQVRSATVADQDRTGRIIALRMRAVHLEERLRDEPSPATAKALGELKLELRDALAATRVDLVPEDADLWWQGLEAHPQPCDVDITWLD